MDNKIKDQSEKLREGNISLVLDSYNDLFSDFDPRPYAQRSLSDDFLFECKKASVIKEDKIELRLMVPKLKRNLLDEVKIKRRLKDHFNKHFKDERRKIKNIKGQGLLWFLLGVILMFTGLFLFEKEDVIFRIIIIMAEPAGWFFFWEGLNKVFIYSKEKADNFDFYSKMVNIDIRFLDY